MPRQRRAEDGNACSRRQRTPHMHHTGPHALVAGARAYLACRGFWADGLAIVTKGHELRILPVAPVVAEERLHLVYRLRVRAIASEGTSSSPKSACPWRPHCCDSLALASSTPPGAPEIDQGQSLPEARQDARAAACMDVTQDPWWRARDTALSASYTPHPPPVIKPRPGRCGRLPRSDLAHSSRA